MSALSELLDQYRGHSKTEREKGTYFEKLVLAWFRHEPSYADLYTKAWLYSDWARERGEYALDTGIDLVAETASGELHAIQCKLYAASHTVQKSEIDSFFTASGKRHFAHRVIVSTTDRWSRPAEAALENQNPPVTTIRLRDLEGSAIDWSIFKATSQVVLKPKKTLRPHQKEAVEAVKSGLAEGDRGKMIMACGTGKTFTSLKIAEEQAGKGRRVLFLVPSLALLSQALTEWTQESTTPLHSFAVCSDGDVGKRIDANADEVPMLTHELQYPATTSAKRLALELSKRHDARHMSVVFSTYHSIEVVSAAQREHGLPAFDLIVCDEAHRTTGATFEDDDESNFVRVHDADYLKATKRLYMTATPRIYGEGAKKTANQKSIALCSMDDPKLFGEQLYVITFSDAVKKGLLVDYKVIVLSIDESHANRRLRALLADENKQLNVNDAAKLVGCWKALSKQGLRGETDDLDPMRRAVAFCQVIEPSTGGRFHKVSSKQIAEMFADVVTAYRESAAGEEERSELKCEVAHVDGTMGAGLKKQHLDWLKAESPEHTCRILSNVRCLSEGVDVPALDAVLFLTPRNSPVDVVQSVGRVMRKSPGKKLGYVILPVVIPAGMAAHEALNDNKTYAVVWQVLQALRSHDDRFDAMINRMDLELNQSILRKMEVIAITDKINPKAKHESGNKTAGGRRGGGSTIGRPDTRPEEVQTELQFEVGEIERAIYARVVEKCGNPRHWEDWAKDIARIAQTHIDRINGMLEDPKQAQARTTFKAFASDLRRTLNDAITDGEVVEMLAQHLITRPVFDALFSEHDFARQNPMSQAMEEVLTVLQAQHLEKETTTLADFYESVRERAKGIESAEGRQKIVVELYDKFFRNAFPKLTERLGIVYTPVEVVDFILNSVDHLLRQEFGQGLGAEGVHILDPFTGTGTFITRLLQSGLISREDLPRKYRHELHANEIVLLAYYIAAVNIEATYHGVVGGAYTPFEGICLTDTFLTDERNTTLPGMMRDNNARRQKQDALDIRVIVGNPPYSVGQERANDNNQNVSYPLLDERIRETYAERTSATLKNSLYDSYVRAIRWASDRVGEAGIVAFVTNAGFLDAKPMNGLRLCLAEEFSSVYVLHLRGNQRTQGETSRREGGKIFGSGSRAPIAISVLVKNPASSKRGRIWFHDIGDYLSREEKLANLTNFGGLAGIFAANLWCCIDPDRHGDWLNQRSDSLAEHIILGAKRNPGDPVLFEEYTHGLKSQRDSWCFNSSRAQLASNIQRMLDAYHQNIGKDTLELNPTKISWSHALKEHVARGQRISFNSAGVIKSIYRPFCAQWAYYDRFLNERQGRLSSVFPAAAAQQRPNRVITVNASYRGLGELALMSDCMPDLHFNGDAQCFPIQLYDELQAPTEPEQASLFGQGSGRRDAITAEGLAHFQARYPGRPLSREDLFYYIYGLLHSEDYRERFAANLTKDLPRIPAVATFNDFQAFSEAGRALADLHVNYEQVEPWAATVTLTAGKGASPRTLAVTERGLDTNAVPPSLFRVDKMRFGKAKAGGKSVADKSVLHYNDHITVTGIPLAAYDYVVSGKAALDWVIERQCVKVDKDSGIVNDANLWATETVGRASYPLELFLRVITVSMKTLEIVRSLPELDIAAPGEVAAVVASPATASEPAKVLPLRRTEPSHAERWVSTVPVISLRAAAGPWSDEQLGLQAELEAAEEWIEVADGTPLARGMFVGQAHGRSMEPEIPDGSRCLFRTLEGRPAAGQRVLAEMASAFPEYEGGRYAVKVYAINRSGQAELRSVNPDFEALPLEPGQVRVVAALVKVLGSDRAPATGPKLETRSTPAPEPTTIPKAATEKPTATAKPTPAKAASAPKATAAALPLLPNLEPRRTPRPAQSPLSAALAALEVSVHPLSRSELIEASGIPEDAWDEVRRAFELRTDIYRFGERRGTRYLAVSQLESFTVNLVSRYGAEGANKADIVSGLADAGRGELNDEWWRYLIDTLCGDGRLVKSGQGRGTRYHAS